MERYSKDGGVNMIKMLTMLFIVCFILPITALAEDNITSNNTISVNTTNETINITPTRTLPLPEEFYGDVKYSDGSDVKTGNIVKAIDQRGNVVGNFIMVYNGSYGDSYKLAPRLIVNAEDTEDIITFYVNDVKSTKSIKFDSGGIKRADIIISSSAKPTQIPTTISTTEPIIVPTDITTAPTAVIVTTETPIPTLPPTPIQTPVLDDPLPKFVGALFIILAICVLGAVITYFILTRKMKREDEEEITL